MKEGKYTGKIENLMEPGDENENKMIKNKVEYDGEEGGETREPQRQKCGKSILIPMTRYVVIAAQVPAETTITVKIITMITRMERRK